MSLKQLIPGILTILTLVFFAIGIFTSSTTTIIIEEDCNTCHQGRALSEEAAAIHVEGGLAKRDCTNCHESIETAHGGFELEECDHCHTTNRGDTMAYTACSNCHSHDPHEDKISTNECITCHETCSTCHNVEELVVKEGRHAELHTNITDIGYSTETCISCHGPAHDKTYAQINKDVQREYTWHYVEE